MKKVIDITDDLRRAERKQKWEDRLYRAKRWISDNKGIAIAAIPILGGIAGKTIKVFGRRRNLKLEQRNRDHRCWDASLGHYWELRRKLSNRDWTEINRRKMNGESLGQILESLRVLR